MSAYKIDRLGSAGIPASKGVGYFAEVRHFPVSQVCGGFRAPMARTSFLAHAAWARVTFLCSPKEKSPKERAPPSPAYSRLANAPLSVGLYAHPCADKPQSDFLSDCPSRRAGEAGRVKGEEEPDGSSGCARHRPGVGLSNPVLDFMRLPWTPECSLINGCPRLDHQHRCDTACRFPGLK